METPARPFTIGGRTMTQTAPRQNPQRSGSSYQRPQQQSQLAAPETPSQSQTQQQSSHGSEQLQHLVTPGVFPSPPGRKAGQNVQYNLNQPYEAPRPYQQPQDQQQQQGEQSEGRPQTQRTGSTFNPSALAKNILGSAKSSTSPSNNQGQQVSQYRPQSAPTQSTSTSSVAKRDPSQQQTPKRKPPNPNNAVTQVPVNQKLAIEARKAVMAKRLRVNLVLLLAWYLVTDSRAYEFIVRELVHAYPPAQTPLIWLADRLLPLLFLYNASEAFLRIRWAVRIEDTSSTLSVAVPTTQQPASTSAGANASTPVRVTPISSATYRSSPKTRPSPASVAINRLSRNSSGGSPLRPSESAPPTSTPPRFFSPSEGTGESPTAALRRSLLASASWSAGATDSQGQQTGTSHPSGLNTSLYGASPNRDSASPRVVAYKARHEPIASNLHRSFNRREDIDRLLAGEA